MVTADGVSRVTQDLKTLVGDALKQAHEIRTFLIGARLSKAVGESDKAELTGWLHATYDELEDVYKDVEAIRVVLSDVSRALGIGEEDADE